VISVKRNRWCKLRIVQTGGFSRINLLNKLKSDSNE
jgi:hypothetical protein